MEHLQGKLPLLIGGQLRTLNFSYKAFSLLLQLAPGTSLDSMPLIESLPVIAYVGLRTGDAAGELPDDFSVDMAADWLMDAEGDTAGQIYALYAHSAGKIGRMVGSVLAVIEKPANPPKSKPKASQ